MPYSFQAAKLARARHYLLFRHTGDAQQAIVDAFHECFLAFHHLDENGLDEEARNSVAEIKGVMDTNGLLPTAHEGTWSLKARSLTADQQAHLSRLVGELSDWFTRRRDE